jgi:hypothetical protein
MTKVASKPKPPQTDLLKSVQAVQLELEPLVTDGVNKFANMHRYATINNILGTLLPLLKKHDLYLVQKLDMSDSGGVSALHTVITHLPSGQFIDSMVPLVVDKPGPQAMGSSVTYFRRYVLTAIFCIQTTDDDGEQAEGRSDSAEDSTQPPAPSLGDKSEQPSAPSTKRQLKLQYDNYISLIKEIEELERLKKARTKVFNLAAKLKDFDIEKSTKLMGEYNMKLGKLQDGEDKADMVKEAFNGEEQ